MLPATGRDVTGASPLRLGVYAESIYRRDGDRLSTIPEAYAFLLFVCALRPRLARLALIGRLAPHERRAAHALPAGIELVPLPHYPSLRSLAAVAAAAAGTVRAVWRGLDGLDAVWVFGPHPVGMVVIALALLRRRRVVLGVRHDTLAYFRARLPGRRWTPLLVVVRLLDLVYRLLARRVPIAVVGEEVAARYGPRAVTLVVSVVRDEDLVAAPAAGSWDGTVRLLTVGRIEPEKAPLVAVDALAELGERFELTWAGDGPLLEETRARAERTGARVAFRGFVPFGPELLRLYHEADAFVHVAYTEGAPAAVVEAMAAALPVVATRVGGVPSLVGDAALLVPPGDAGALAAAVRRLAGEEQLRSELAGRALEQARALTIERQLERVLRLLSDGA